jgi:hypothetical protein
MGLRGRPPAFRQVDGHSTYIIMKDSGTHPAPTTIDRQINVHIRIESIG